MTESTELESYRIEPLPSAAYYIPDFISPHEEKFLLEKITNVPDSRWTTLSHRKLQTYPTQLLKGTVLPTADALPTWLAVPCASRMKELGIWDNSPHLTANHCLVNCYEPGQGIMPHEDGDVYFPMVATVSLQDGIVLDIYRKELGPAGERVLAYRIYQEPRSLLITTENMYTDFLHGIQELKIDKDLSPSTISNWKNLSFETQQRILMQIGQNQQKRREQVVESGEQDMCVGAELPREKDRISLTFRDVKKVRNFAAFLRKS
ncbi:calpain [Myxozyma melibiosi]|uniref:Calpain n=1 Tax=Myxozyma melibiosi TaxID=54550 RepID=A0ABR1FBN8_9ASCO